MACNKTSYSSKRAATEDARIIKSRQRHFSGQAKSKKSNMKLRAYLCPKCGKWHLTSMKKRRK